MARDVVTKQPDATKPANVVPLFRRRPIGEDEPETRMGLASVGGAVSPSETAVPSSLDLSGKPKIWFMIGAGNSGKTVEVR